MQKGQKSQEVMTAPTPEKLYTLNIMAEQNSQFNKTHQSKGEKDPGR